MPTRRPRVDPSEWARRRQEALEKARKTAGRRDRDRIQSSSTTSRHSRRPPTHGSNASASSSASAHEYAESQLQQQHRVALHYEEDHQYHQPQHQIRSHHHPPRHGGGRGRGRGRGRRASSIGGLDGGLGDRSSIGNRHQYEPTPPLEGQYEDADSDLHSQYSARRAHDLHDRRFHYAESSSSVQKPSSGSAQIPPPSASSHLPLAAEYAPNKLSLLKQRMLERKNHRRRAIGRPISRYASKSGGILGGAGGGSSMFRELRQPTSMSAMSDRPQYDGGYHQQDLPQQQQRQSRHIHDSSRYDHYDETDQPQQQHEQRYHRQQYQLTGSAGDVDDNDDEFEEDGHMRGLGSRTETSIPHYADNHSDPFGQRRKVAGINHDEQPVGPARSTTKEDHDEQPVGPTRSSRRDHNEKAVGPAISLRNHEQQLNWDEQPVGSSSRRRHHFADNVPEVDPYMYEHRMYDENQQGSPFSGSSQNQSSAPRYAWDDDEDENSPDDDVDENVQYQQEQIPANPAASDARTGTTRAGTSKASRLMHRDEQPVGRKLSMGPQEDDDSQGDISMQHCKSCDKAFAPPTFQKLCAALDHDGQPRCVKIYNQKRKVYNSAKTRIKNNTALNAEEQKVVIAGRKRVVSEMKAKKSGKKRSNKNKNSKWKEESKQFREAMKANREWARQGM